MGEIINNQVQNETVTAHTIEGDQSPELALEALRDVNNMAVSYLQVLELRREAAEKVKQQLDEQRRLNEKEFQELDRLNNERGGKYEAVRRRLGRNALKLLEDQSDTVEDRPELWEVFVEYHLAHYFGESAKKDYTERLVEIDTLLRAAHDTNTSLPILMTGPYARSAIGMSDPAASGLHINTTHHGAADRHQQYPRKR